MKPAGGAPRIVRRHIDGVLLLDKPHGWSSSHAVQAVKRAYIKSNPKETLAFARAIIAAHDVIHNDRATAYEVLRRHVKRLSDEQVNAMLDRMRGPSGFFKKAELSREGIENVFKLRAVYGGEKPVTDFSKYIDPTVAQRALTGK